ncbi:MAG: DUF4358 domain-containing protein [Emergencia sp.]
MRLKKILKITAAAAAVVLLLSSFAGCGEEEAEDRCVSAVEAAMEMLGDSTKLDTVAAYGEEIYEDNFQRLYNFSINEVGGGAIAYAADGGAADEISIVMADDSSSTSEIRKYMEARLQQRLHDFSGYKPEEVSKIENGRVAVMKNYVFLIISDRSAEIETEIKKALNS